MADLRRLVTTTNQLQQQLQAAVQHLEHSDVNGAPSTSAVNVHSTPATPKALQLLSTNSSSSESLSSLFKWNPRSSTGQKRKGLFSSHKSGKKKKIPTWSHTFVCLASINQEIIPDSQERGILQIAGLGEKRISLSVYADAQDIYHELSAQFPRLSGGGGFELLRVPEGGGKQLDVIATPESGYTTVYLKAVVHHAKVYIRPLQKDLCLDPVKEELWSALPKEECLKCGELVSITALREHMVTCERQSTLSFDDSDVLKVISVVSPVMKNSPNRSPSPPIPIDPVLEVALHLSREEEEPTEDKEKFAEATTQTIADVIKVLRKGIDNDSFDMIIRRSNVLSDALRRMERLSFDPQKKLNVVFVGEEGSDIGGLTREFFRILSYSISSNIWKQLGVLNTMLLHIRMVYMHDLEH